MNTPAHILLGAALFAPADRPRVARAAVAGALLPDLSLYLMAAVSIWVLGIPPQRVFDELYFSDAWQSVFALDNSIPLWTFGLLMTRWRGSSAGTAFFAAGLVHLLSDFALHHDDARRMLWPLSDWVFHSPVSYWDPRHFGGIAGLAEIAMALVCAAVLWRRFPGRVARGLTLALAGAELLPGLLFRFMH
jgi:membrane-bound metal-dependent hydrolase YbcI (DUF457 family)